jgi:hypothetical protein
MMNLRSGTLCLLGLVALQSPFPQALAQDYRQEREQARREVAPYFGKQVAMQSALVESTGPEIWEKMFGPKYKLVGCPEQPLNPADPTKELSFRTSGPGNWVGGVDGINIAITAPDGTKGGSVAYPTNSTARLPEDNATGTKYEFFFDATLNVRRALVDAAIAEFDRCFSKLPPGRYAEGESERLCPYRPVSRDQQKQTCVVSTTGTIGKPLADGSGYEVQVNESTQCDFVGFGKGGDTSTSFTSCFNNSYKGVATLSTQATPETEKQKFLLSVKNRMVKMCSKTKAGRKMSNVKMQQCVVKQMAKVMVGRNK